MPFGEGLKTGSARVRSTLNNGVVCDASAIDPINDPPVVMRQLTVTSPKKQKL